MVFTLDGEDFHDMVDTAQYVVTPRRVTGNNSRYTQSGDYYEDLLAIKKDLTIVTVPASQVELSKLLNTCMNSYVDLKFIDPITNSNLEGKYIPSVGEVKNAIEGSSGETIYWYAVTIQFQQR